MQTRIVKEQCHWIGSTGPVRIIWRTGSRSIRLSIKPFNGVVLRVPSRLSLEQAEKFVREKESWIRRARERVRSAEQQYTLFTEHTLFRTYRHILHIKRNVGPGLSSVVRNGSILVTIPEGSRVEDKPVQEEIRAAIVRALRKEAREYLPDRVYQLAREHGFTPGTLSFRNNSSRWGSCSFRGHISLNIHLMRLPPQLVDYVILHELVHTRFPHHQKEFRARLQQLCGEAKTLEQELRKYHTQIF